MHRSGRAHRAGLSLLEAVLASAIIGASFVAFFGLAGQSMASASEARNATTCAFLAESQMNRLLSVEWVKNTAAGSGTADTNIWAELDDLTADPSDGATSESDGTYLYSLYALEHPDVDSTLTGTPAAMYPAHKTAVNAAFATSGAGFGPNQYYVTWDTKANPWSTQAAVSQGKNQDIWARIRVRCVYRSAREKGWHGMTIQTYRFANPVI
jgi:Tfp pilus assembly protein PilV